MNGILEIRKTYKPEPDVLYELEHTKDLSFTDFLIDYKKKTVRVTSDEKIYMFKFDNIDKEIKNNGFTIIYITSYFPDE